MKLLLASVVALSAGAAGAQEVPQASNQWYSDAQATLQEMLSRQQNTNRARNVILFVADGNGIASNYATRIFTGQEQGGYGDEYVQPQEAFPNLALVKTYTTNGLTPDSAPTAAAFNSGVKAKNDVINVTDAVAVDDCEAGAADPVTLLSETHVGGWQVGRHRLDGPAYPRHAGGRLRPHGEPRLGGGHAGAGGLRAARHRVAARRADECGRHRPGPGRRPSELHPCRHDGRGRPGGRPRRRAQPARGDRWRHRRLRADARGVRRDRHGNRRGAGPRPLRAQPHALRSRPLGRAEPGRDDPGRHRGRLAERAGLLPHGRGGSRRPCAP